MSFVSIDSKRERSRFPAVVIEIASILETVVMTTMTCAVLKVNMTMEAKRSSSMSSVTYLSQLSWAGSHRPPSGVPS